MRRPKCHPDGAYAGHGLCRPCYDSQKVYDPIKGLAANLKKAHKITPEQRAEMLEKQNGHCAICPRTTCSAGWHLAIDHCHKTGKIRGLLCDRCNFGIGLFGDDPKLMARAIKYLKVHANG